MSPRPVLWSIAGTDSGGGAGLSADQRAADALQVHLCPVVAALTAQNSQTVTHVQPVGVDMLEHQIQALAQDMPPQAIKTGLLGNAQQIACVAHWVDRLRQRGPVALVIDPVLGASTGSSFANDEAIQAYCQLLVPRATLITPNQHEAWQLLQSSAQTSSLKRADIPAQARALLSLGCEAICITGGDTPAINTRDANWALDWMHTPQAQGWMAAPRVATPHTHGTGCTFATAAAAAMARGFVTADALILAKMATLQALRQAQAAGAGAGAVRAQADFITNPSLMPRLSWDEDAYFPSANTNAAAPTFAQPINLYAAVDSIERLHQMLAAGVRTLQLRIKTAQPITTDGPNGSAALLQTFKAAVQAARAAQARLFINDHADLALQAGAQGVHLGQEDLLALTQAQRAQLAQDVDLGISSHSLWELCRAITLNPCYIACGPIWPTTTKAMPWRPQGIDNLAWWCAMAPCPVVAIGGILSAAEVQQAAQAGADGICLVRGWGEEPHLRLPAFERALQAGRASKPPPIAWPHPSLSTNSHQGC